MNRRIVDQESKPEEESLSASEVDIPLLRKYLAMTPTERLGAFYTGAQGRKALREEGYRAVLVR